MKQAIVLALFLAALPALAQQAHRSQGVVTKVGEDRVTIRHEPIPSLNWPTMNMAFKVKDKAMLERMKKDQKVEFEFAQEGRDYVITAVK
jgi:Cu(I)/Ag(I) efflux system protein CusF